MQDLEAVKAQDAELNKQCDKDFGFGQRKSLCFALPPQVFSSHKALGSNWTMQENVIKDGSTYILQSYTGDWAASNISKAI